MDYFPIFTKLTGKRCLLIGAGEVASRKLDLLLQAGATVRVVAPQIGESVESLANKYPQVDITKTVYDKEWLNGVQLVIAATNDTKVNEQIYHDANARHLFVNVVDQTHLCSFITPAIVDRSPITIAISTAGKAPVLARLLRGKLESLIPSSYGKLAQLADKFRKKVKSALTTSTARKNFWEAVFEGDIAEKVFNQQHKEAEKDVEKLLNQHKFQTCNHQGEVYLVGAGPGDVDLLTFRALRVMQKADVVVHDKLVSDDILNLVRRDAERIYVGKEKAHHCVPQDKINELLIDLARQGKRVVRLKGGDPYIFGRGGEEAQQLVAAGISFQVIPGITSAAGASTYCGIPLTHRDYAQSVTFATGHLKNNTVDLNWQALAQSNNTLVIYMGLTGLPIIAEQLQHHGLASRMPVAVIQNATRKNQKVVTGTLASIDKDVKRAQITSPAIIVIGEVVKLYQELAQTESVEAALSA